MPQGTVPPLALLLAGVASPQLGRGRSLGSCEDVVVCCRQAGRPVTRAQVGASGSVGLVRSECRAEGDRPVSRAVRAPCARREVLGGPPL